MKKTDLFSSCNDQGMSEKDFTGMFCNRCKNRSCERAGWAFSSWDERIGTQADRLLNRPNIVLQKDHSRWEGLSDLESLPHQGVIEVWGATKVEPAPAEKPLVILTDPPLVDTSVVAAPQPLKRQLNVAPKEHLIGTPSLPVTPPKDEWAIPPKTLKVGATFKMGGS